MSSTPSPLPPQLPPDQNHRVALEVVWWTFFSIATVFIILRFWARILKRTFGFDDLVMAACYVFFLAEAILITYVAETGRTRHLLYLGGLPEIDSTIMYYIIILDVGIFVTGLGKVAIGITTLRIFGDTSLWQRWVVWTVLALTIGTCFLDFGISTFRCGDPNLTWTLEAQATAKCVVSTDAQSDINLFSNIVQVLADFAFSILPMAVIWGLHMPQRRKKFLLVALGLTLLTGVAGTVKTVYAATFDEQDLSFTIFPNLVWFGVEAVLIIVCGSVPTLHPLYERYIKQRRRGYRSQNTPLFGQRTYVNSGGRGFSKVSGAKSRERFSSRTHDDSSLKTLHNSDDAQMQQQLASFEMMKLDGYPKQAPGSARAIPHDPDAWNCGGIQIIQEVEVANPSRSSTDV
ncbi:hypothetical protein E0Z10_g2194 [Xylaria hypoxylon]|uniref:Rhodopsin domain-containing protein n=1 Tax=Xylaria hypoxylon TaxID=37992 RepID=A0A4Z0Z557_9PEZI|nr:hypothetical protein E0Z10_g2194 [Xylaria hypoxylon]